MIDISEKHLLLKAIEPYSEEYNIDLKVFPLEWFYAVDDLRNYKIVFPFETQLSRAKFFLNAENTWILSIVISLIYIALMFGGQKLMSYRAKPFQLRYSLIIWNLSMTIFSIIGFFRVSPELFRILSNQGFIASICQCTYGKDPVAAFWICAFVSSKFVELLDTAFLVLRKRPVKFLHWYHHVTVLVFSWHSAKGVTAAGRWYAWMNYGVHSFMYGYYTATSLNYRPPRWVAIGVTAMQIVQMLSGVAINYTVYHAKTFWNTACHQSKANLRFALVIYISFFILFVKLFYDNYLKPKAKQIGKEQELKKKE